MAVPSFSCTFSRLFFESRSINHGGTQLVNIGAEDIMEGKVGLVLGLTWELIKFYDLGGSSKSGAATKLGGGTGTKAEKAAVVSELMDWCKAQIKDIEGVKVDGPITKALADGNVFAGMISSNRPDLMQFDEMKGMVRIGPLSMPAPSQNLQYRHNLARLRVSPPWSLLLSIRAVMHT